MASSATDRRWPRVFRIVNRTPEKPATALGSVLSPWLKEVATVATVAPHRFFRGSQFPNRTHETREIGVPTTVGKDTPISRGQGVRFRIQSDGKYLDGVSQSARHAPPAASRIWQQSAPASLGRPTPAHSLHRVHLHR
jgi:hypothetical protein